MSSSSTSAGDIRDYPHTSAFDRCKEMLTGYKHQDIPDLAARRFPAGVVHARASKLTTSNLPASEQTDVICAAVVAAIGRVLGAYCTSRDILLAIVDGDKSSLRPIRVQWDENRSWDDLIHSLAGAISSNSLPEVSLTDIREVLGLNEKQPPCLATIQFSGTPTGSCHASIPLSFSFNTDSLLLSAATPDVALHASVLELLISQIRAIFSHSLRDVSSAVSLLTDLPRDVLSVHEKLSLEERKVYYHRIPHVRMTTDHLIIRAQTIPSGIALRWYPLLSPDEDPSLLHFESLTFVEWDRKANQFGRWLLRKGLQLEDRVAVCMERNVWFHIALIGILRAGGCYVPIDSELPPERQSFIAEDSNARFVLTSSKLMSFDLFGSLAVDIDDSGVQSQICQESADDLQIPGPENLSYLLYTSGTTGTPKGCLLTHDGLTESIWAIADMCVRAYEGDPQDGGILSVASVAFDVHLSEILPPIATGLPIVSAPRSLLLEDLPHYVKALRVSHIGTVPSLIDATMNAVQDDVNAGHVSSLRYLASGGEKISDAILDKWGNHPIVRLANFYGPTEATIGVAARFMDRLTPRANIGSTFSSLSSYVVDEHMNIVLRGSPGELIVEGPLVGRGYIGRPDLTEKAFLEFPEKGTGRWAYRTGDLVRMMPDSTLEILGRIDTQIKLRGVRIESEGISSIIRNAVLPDFTLDAVTLLARHPSIGSDQIVSFIAWDNSVPIATRKSVASSFVPAPAGLLDRIEKACEQHLPSYMRPSHIIPLNWISVNNNVKTDANALLKLFTSLDIDTLTRHAQDREEADEPLDDDEKAVVAVISEHLGIPSGNFGPRSNLFECGLDSMGAIKLAARLRKSFNAQISAADLMRHPTIRAVANHVRKDASVEEQQRPSATKLFAETWRNEVVETLPSLRIDNILPSFPIQEGVLSRSIDVRTMYVQHVFLELKSGTSFDRLQDAWNKTASERQILRAVFLFARDLVQVILHPDECQVSWTEKNTSDDDANSFRDHFLRTDASIVSININEHLSETPPFRFNGYTSPSGKQFLVLSIHHALFDGISLPLLLADVEQAYLGQSLQPNPSPNVILDCIASIDTEKARKHWADIFSGYDWRKTSSRVATEPTATTISVPFKTSLSSLQQKAAAQRTTIQALLMSAYAYLIATSMYGEDDVVFGVIRAGRLLPVEGVETARYPLLSLTPVRVNFAWSENILENVQRNISSSVDFEHVSLGRVAQWVRGGKALFETLFSISYKEDGPSPLWSTAGSQNPEPEYILAVEIVLDTLTDSIVARAAYTSKDLPSYIAEGIAQRIEEVVLQFSDDDIRNRLVSAVIGSRTATPGTDDAGDIEDTLNDNGPLDETIAGPLRKIISGFLRLDEELITADASLVGLGLDSIRSVGLSRAIRTQGYQISSVEIMKYPTIRRMVNFLTSQKSGKSENTQGKRPSGISVFDHERISLQKAIDIESVKLAPNDVIQLYPTTMLQAGMLSQTVSSGGKRYFHIFPLQLKETVDISRVREAWSCISAAHSILRTSFHFASDLGLWAQAVHSTSDLKWSEGPIRPSEEYLYGFLASKHWEGGEGFRYPPLYLHLMTDSGTGERILLLIMHHAIYDGISANMLVDLVQKAYYGEIDKVFTQFFDILPQVIQEERHGTSFWLRKLRKLENVKVLPRRAQVHEDASYFGVFNTPVDRTAVQSIQRTAGVTVQAIAQVAFAKLLAVLTGSRDVVFGHVVSGRSIPSAEDVLGPMLNTVPSRVQLTDRLKNLDLMKATHAANVDALPWQHASLRAIHQALGVARIWDSLFVFQPAQPSSLQHPPIWEFNVDDESEPNIQYPLNVEVHETTSGFQVKAACHAELMDQAGVEAALTRYEQILVHLIQHIDHDCTEDIPEVPAIPAATKSEPEPKPKPSASTEEISVDTLGEDYVTLLNILIAATKISAEHINPSSHLISLGVDSITAIQLAGKYRRVGVPLRAEDILRCRTVADVVRKIESSKLSSVHVPSTQDSQIRVAVPASEAAAIRNRFDGESQALIEDIVPASSGIKWLIGAWQKSNGSRFQHAFAYSLPSDVDIGKLKNAWVSLLERHAILRSTIACASGSDEPRLVIFKPNNTLLTSTWQEVALENSFKPKDEVENIMKHLVSSSPDLKRPPTRALFVTAPNSTYLVLYMNHFQYDAWSLHLLADDLGKLYISQVPSSSNALIPWLQASAANDAALAEQKSYWNSVFPSSVKPSFFPSLRGPGGVRRLVYTNPKAIIDATKLNERARSEGLSPNAIFLAAWSKVHSQYTSDADSVFGLWHSGRSAPLDHIERLAVPCMNVLPMYVAGSGNRTVVELAHKIQKDLRARTPAIEQTNLVKLDEWVHGKGRALCNVYVNIVKVAPDVEGSESSRSLLTAVEIPYYIPDKNTITDDFVERLKVTDLIQDDIMIDIVALPTGAVLVSLETSEKTMDENQAEQIVAQWVNLVESCLD